MGNAENERLKSPRQATNVDEVIGKEIRLRRRMVGMSQAELANAVGVASQQIQKYEIGANRLSVSRLVQIAKILDAPVFWFFRNVQSSSNNDPADWRAHLDETVSNAAAGCKSCETALLLYEILPKKVG